MKPTSFATIALLVSCAIVTSCTSSRQSSELPSASIGPQLNNNTNPPMEARNASGTLGTIERLDPALDALLPPDAKVEILVENSQWAEGPVWGRGGLVFSAVPPNT